MNIDARLEALTQSVELLAAMHQDLEKKWDARMSRMLDIMEGLSETTKRMERMIAIHDERLSGHDKRFDNLEQ
ncbi:MAG TPA: hypothetical protein VE959_29780 [Bryobacteraceae bacterium]|nr:hypothetical protein [Bryobacteraceae bacterium]